MQFVVAGKSVSQELASKYNEFLWVSGAIKILEDHLTDPWLSKFTSENERERLKKNIILKKEWLKKVMGELDILFK